MGVGKEAVRKGLVDAGGARVVASECPGSSAEELALLNAVMVCFPICLLIRMLTYNSGCTACVATQYRHVRLTQYE